MSYKPPAGPPPTRSTSNNPFADDGTASSSNVNPIPVQGLPEEQIPSDPPPAYTPSANMSGSTTVASGPSHVDFSGPPPMPDRIANQQTGVGVNVTGVGMGYGRGGGHHGWGGGSEDYSGPTNTDGLSKPPVPPRNHSSTSNRPPPPLPPRAQPQDLTPTEVPTPGRPLLRGGQLLVYPKGHWCPKCQNTGYKSSDPSNPHESDWRKYGKPYNSALAHSYTYMVSNPDPAQGVNAGTAASSNFQRPLPSYSPAGGSSSGSNSYAHLPPPPGKWNTYPGQNAPPRPPPPPPNWGAPPMPGQQIFVQRSAGPVPPGALVVRPGDPRIGGQLCWRCSGSGRELSFFGFDDSKCWECRGLGRLF
ncbi:hypothetical protein J007_03448 [Cryptococcus neoformans]|nr:hypothetical protein J007_03448 [Cryptococcus neoformans var. grubii]OXC61014.1 hypothetical protein C358_03541 [Cryptococcus neoformans var. grubii MW-RSA852]